MVQLPPLAGGGKEGEKGTDVSGGFGWMEERNRTVYLLSGGRLQAGRRLLLLVVFMLTEGDEEEEAAVAISGSIKARRRRTPGGRG